MYYPVGRFDRIQSTFWNPLDQFRANLQNSNYTIAVNSEGGSLTPCAGLENNTIFASGKWYWEIVVEQCTATGANPHASLGIRQNLDGLSPAGGNIGARVLYSPGPSAVPNQTVWHSNSSGALVAEYGNHLTVTLTGVTGFSAGDRLMFAFDVGAGKLWLGKNGTWFNSGDPAAGTNPQFTGFDTALQGGPFTWRFFFSGNSNVAYSGTPVKLHGAFGNSLFPQVYTPPTGFTSLLTKSAADFYAAWNPRDSGPGGAGGWQFLSSNMALSNYADNGSLFVGDSDVGGNSAALLHPGSKYYFELSVGVSVTGTACSIRARNDAYEADNNIGTACIWVANGTLARGASTTIVMDSTGVTTYATTDRLMFAVDLVNNKMWVGKGGTWTNGGNPAAGTNHQFSVLPEDIWTIHATITSGSRSFKIWAPGDFLYSAPSGFNAGVPLSVAAP